MSAFYYCPFKMLIARFASIATLLNNKFEAIPIVLSIRVRSYISLLNFKCELARITRKQMNACGHIHENSSILY